MSNIISYVLGAIILVLAVACIYLYITRAHDEVLIAGDQTVIDEYKTQNGEFVKQVKVANASLRQIQNESDARAAAAQKAVEDAHKVATDAYQRAANLIKAKPQGDDCSAANTLINSYLGAAK